MPKVIYFGCNDCHRAEVLRMAGYEVRESGSLDFFTRDMQRVEQVDAVVLNGDDRQTAAEAAKFAHSLGIATVILFKRSEDYLPDGAFDCVFSSLVPPEIWLSEIKEMIARRQALRPASRTFL